MASAAGGDSQDVIDRRSALAENEKKINNMIFEKNIAKLDLETDKDIKNDIINIVNDKTKSDLIKMAELKAIHDKNITVVKNVIILSRLKPLVDQRTVLYKNLQAAKTLQDNQARQAANLAIIAQASQASQVPMASVPSSPSQVTPALPQQSIFKRCFRGLCGKDSDSTHGGKRRKTTTRKQKGRRTAKKQNKNKKSRKQ